MYEHIDSWKNSTEAFDQQLTVNIKELNKGFPPHWQHFVGYVQRNHNIHTNHMNLQNPKNSQEY